MTIWFLKMIKTIHLGCICFSFKKNWFWGKRI